MKAYEARGHEKLKSPQKPKLQTLIFNGEDDMQK